MSHSKDRESSFLHHLATGLEGVVPSGSSVLLAVSGGPDSVALLLGYSKIADQRSDRLHVAHFDHQLRPESKVDTEFVRSLCQALHLPCTIGIAETSIEQGPGSLEENARNSRYQFLLKTANEVGAQFVGTGHTADDQAETVLFAILRGTGIHGLGGMPSRRPLDSGVMLVRPLLNVRRREIQSFLKSEHVESRIDDSNSDARFTRNRIRHRLLPMLREEFNPRVDDALLRLSQLASGAAKLLDEKAAGLLTDALLTDTHVAEGITSVLLRREPFVSVDRFVAGAAFRLLLDQLGWPRQQIGQVELERMVDMLNTNSPHAIDLPGGLRIERVKKPVAALRLLRKNHSSELS